MANVPQSVNEFLAAVAKLTPEQERTIVAVVASLTRAKFVIDTYGDGSELTEFDRYHQAVAQVSSAARGADMSALLPVWQRANLIQNHDVSVAVRVAGEAIALRNVLPDEAFHIVTEPLRAALA